MLIGILRLPGEWLNDPFNQIAHTLAVGGGNRNRLSETKFVKLGRDDIRIKTFCLVDY